MASFLGMVLLVPALAAALVVTALVGLGRRTDVVPSREWRLVKVTRVLGLVGGVVAGFWMLTMRNRFENGLSVLLAPAVFGLVVVAGVALGETVVRRRREPGPRTASLRPRTWRAYVARPTTAAVAAVGAALLVTLAFTTLTASRADDGRFRALACSAGGGGQAVTPYPGAFYSVPLVTLLALTLAVALLATYRVVRRPRGLATTDHGDDILRKRSLTVIVAAVGVAVCTSFAGVGLVAGDALLSLDMCGPAWANPLGVVLFVGAFASLLLALWCLVRVVSNDSLEQPWS